MLRRLIIIILTLAWGLCYGQTLSGYRYWYDSDINAAKFVKSSGNDISLSLPMEDQTPGVHFLNFMAINSENAWGPLYRYIYYLPEEIKDKRTITSYEYWIDDNYTGKTTVKSSDTEQKIVFDVSSLDKGLHFFNYRAIDNLGDYSDLQRYVFYLTGERASTAKLASYEYWIDDDYENKKTANASGSEIAISMDISALAAGVHFMNVRARNNGDGISDLNRYVFYIPRKKEVAKSPIEGYRYGFNGNFKYEKVKADTTYETTNAIFTIPDVMELATVGNHCTFSIDTEKDVVSMKRTNPVDFVMQFKNQNGEWGESIAESFTIDDSLKTGVKKMEMQIAAEFKKMRASEFGAFKFDIPESRSYFLKSNDECSVMLFKPDGTKVTDISGEQMKRSFQYGFDPGTYYGIVYNTVSNSENTSADIRIRLLTTANYVPSPVISYADGKVAISEELDGATIYYTTDGSEPTTESTVYTEPFAVDRNVLVRAMATYEDLDPSDIVSYQVEAFKVTAPTVSFANLKVHISCETAETQIYYTIDGSDPAENGILYTEPFGILTSCTIKAVAKRDGYTNSDIVEQQVDVNNVKCSKPAIALDGNSFTVTTLTEGVTLYYTTDGTDATTESNVYTGAVSFTHNCIIKVIAVKAGLIDSDIAQMEVNWFVAEKPTLVFSDETLTMTSPTPGARIYYEIGGNEPTAESTLYTAPVKLTDNRIVKAVTIADNYNNSEIAEYQPTTFTCATPVIAYDGHSVSITSATVGATVFYTIDGTEPPLADGETTDGSSILLSGLCTVKAVAVKDFMIESAVTTLDVPAYYNGGVTYVATPGKLGDAYQWCGTSDLRSIKVEGNINATDIAALKAMTSVEHLDLSEAAVEEKTLADEALAGMSLISFSSPKDISSVGARLMKDNKRLAAIVWNANIAVPTDILDGVAHPNMLLYVNQSGLANATTFPNTVSNGVAQSITLSDATEFGNFYCPIEFTASKISYSHEYGMPTQKTICQGWETIALPFEVKSITHTTNGDCAPFKANNNNAKPFWLRSLDGGFVDESKIKANTPYIIAMPNNEEYSDMYNLNGKITFAAENVSVKPYTAQNDGQNGNFRFVPNYIYREKNDTLMAINLYEEYNGHNQGSIFVSGLRDVKPFEAYITSDAEIGHAAVYDIENTTGIQDLPIMYKGANIFSKNGKLYIYSNANGEMVLYNVNGQAVKRIELHEGLNEISDLNKGVYVSRGTKVIVN